MGDLLVFCQWQILDLIQTELSSLSPLSRHLGLIINTWFLEGLTINRASIKLKRLNHTEVILENPRQKLRWLTQESLQLVAVASKIPLLDVVNHLLTICNLTFYSNTPLRIQ